MDIISEELLVIPAIYSAKNEVVMDLDEDQLKRFSITITPEKTDLKDLPNGTKLTVSFTVSPPYPEVVPCVSIDCSQMKKSSILKLKKDLMLYANELKSSPMIMEMVIWIQQHAHEYLDESDATSSASTADQELWYTVVHIDHMRSKAKYIKTLQRWSVELGLIGRLFFHHQLILLLVIGRAHDVKEFIHQLKSQKIDVDSSGQRCKEKMSSVVAEGLLCSSSFNKECEDFKIVECATNYEVETEFDVLSLGSVFKTFLSKTLMTAGKPR